MVLLKFLVNESSFIVSDGLINTWRINVEKPAIAGKVEKPDSWALLWGVQLEITEFDDSLQAIIAVKIVLCALFLLNYDTGW